MLNDHGEFRQPFRQGLLGTPLRASRCPRLAPDPVNNEAARHNGTGPETQNVYVLRRSAVALSGPEPVLTIRPVPGWPRPERTQLASVTKGAR